MERVDRQFLTQHIEHFRRLHIVQLENRLIVLHRLKNHLAASSVNQLTKDVGQAGYWHSINITQHELEHVRTSPFRYPFNLTDTAPFLYQ